MSGSKKDAREYWSADKINEKKRSYEDFLEKNEYKPVLLSELKKVNHYKHYVNLRKTLGCKVEESCDSSTIPLFPFKEKLKNIFAGDEKSATLEDIVAHNRMVKSRIKEGRKRDFRETGATVGELLYYQFTIYMDGTETDRSFAYSPVFKIPKTKDPMKANKKLADQFDALVSEIAINKEKSTVIFEKIDENVGYGVFVGKFHYGCYTSALYDQEGASMAINCPVLRKSIGLEVFENFSICDHCEGKTRDGLKIYKGGKSESLEYLRGDFGKSFTTSKPNFWISKKYVKNIDTEREVIVTDPWVCKKSGQPMRLQSEVQVSSLLTNQTNMFVPMWGLLNGVNHSCKRCANFFTINWTYSLNKYRCPLVPKRSVVLPYEQIFLCYDEKYEKMYDCHGPFCKPENYIAMHYGIYYNEQTEEIFQIPPPCTSNGEMSNGIKETDETWGPLLNCIGGFAPTKESLPWTLQEKYPEFYKKDCWKKTHEGEIIYNYNNKSGDWKHCIVEKAKTSIKEKLEGLPAKAQGNTLLHQQVDHHFHLFPPPIANTFSSSSFCEYMKKKKGCLTLGDGLEIKRSPGKGYGLFLTKRVEKEQKITWYEGHDVLNMAPSSTEGRSTRRKHNVGDITEEKKTKYAARKNWFLAIGKSDSPIIVGNTSSDYVRDPTNPAWEKAGIMSFANSTAEKHANCRRDLIINSTVPLKIKNFQMSDIVILKSKRRIEAGEELMFNYFGQE